MFARLLDTIGDGVPDARQYQMMPSVVLDFPQARGIAVLDPFSAAYRDQAMAFYLALRGRAEQSYVVARDEAASAGLPARLWTDLTPWVSRDLNLVAEHSLAWGHIFRHVNLPVGGSLLEYGPGSGQILLILARMGFRACGVDIDPVALESIRAQAAHLDLAVETERAEFGGGFAGERFDCILFYEAFHHAFDFDALLLGLHDRIKPGGRIVLCGEPITRAPYGAIPYPWGPRLDALSVFCIRRFGWMELGFTHDFLIELARATGWRARLHRFPRCHRASVYVLTEDAPAPCSLHEARRRGAIAWRRRAVRRAVTDYGIKTFRLLRRIRSANE